MSQTQKQGKRPVIHSKFVVGRHLILLFIIIIFSQRIQFFRYSFGKPSCMKQNTNTTNPPVFQSRHMEDGGAVSKSSSYLTQATNICLVQDFAQVLPHEEDTVLQIFQRITLKTQKVHELLQRLSSSLKGIYE